MQKVISLLDTILSLIQVDLLIISTAPIAMLILGGFKNDTIMLVLGGCLLVILFLIKYFKQRVPQQDGKHEGEANDNRIKI